jgi:serine/threonine protein kinase
VLAPQYTVERELATGGMGVVFLGTDVALDRRVAIKVLRPEYTSPVGRQRFAREARALAKLQHPNVVVVHQASEVSGVRYFVMDYIAGRTLAARLVEGPLETEAVRALGHDLLSALEAAHRAGIIHRDVKPANVFLVDDRALLGDFGIASIGDTTDPVDPTLTHAGERIGTPAYMAPEQLAGEAASARTDIYGLGLVLYEACSGKRWQPATDPDQGDWGGIPLSLRPALRKALAVAPTARWPDAASFRRALRRPAIPLLIPAALAAIVLVVLISTIGRRGPRTGQPMVRTDLAVVPFTGSGRDDAVAQRLARYAANELEWFPAWRLTSVPATFAWWTSTPPERRALQAPTALGARFYAEGEMADSNRTVRVSVRDSTGGPYYRLTIPGDSGNLPAWGSAVADSIVRILFPQHLDAFRDVAARGSRNVLAYTVLFAGQEAFRIDDWAGAEALYRKALELDPRFAQAAWELALVRRWRERSFEAEWRRLYEEHRAQLPQLQQLIIAAQLEPDLRARFAALEAASRQYPGSAEALLLQADELFHRGPLVGIPLDSGVTLWAAALARGSYLTAYQHISLGEIRLGRQAEAHRALQALDQDRGAATVGEARQRARLIGLTYDARFRPWRGNLKLSWLAWRADSAALMGLAQYVRFALFFDLPDVQRRIGELLIRRGQSSGIRAQGHEARGIALMAQGRPRAAVAAFDSAANLFGTPEAAVERAEWRLLPAALGLPPMDSASAAQARSILAAAPGPLAVRAAWALAVDAATTGDTAAFAFWRGRLATGSHRSPSEGRLAGLLDALALARAGDVSGALARSDSLLVYDGALLTQAPFARALLYLRRGEWFAASHAASEADRAWLWYEGFDVEGWPDRGVQAGEVDAVAGVLARLLRGELAAQRGDSSAACAYAARVRQLWDHAESSYARLRRRADALAAACRR